MTKSPYIRPFLAKEALEYEPPLIRETLAKQREFRKEYGIELDAFIAFGDSDISIKRSALFDKIRKILKDGAASTVNDAAGRQWKVSREGKENGLPNLVISQKEKR